MDIYYESDDVETCCSSYIFPTREVDCYKLQNRAEMNPKSCHIGIGYRPYHFVLKISKRGHSNISYELQDLFEVLCGICEFLILSDVEIVLWAIYLERFAWQEFLQCSKNALLFAAYASKCMLNENTKEFFERLQQRSESFSQDYKVWIGAHQNIINVDYFEMNSIYNELNYSEIEMKEESVVDYNDIVSELIESTAETQRKRLGSDDSYTEKKRNY